MVNNLILVCFRVVFLVDYFTVQCVRLKNIYVWEWEAFFDWFYEDCSHCFILLACFVTAVGHCAYLSFDKDIHAFSVCWHNSRSPDKKSFTLTFNRYSILHVALYNPHIKFDSSFLQKRFILDTLLVICFGCQTLPYVLAGIIQSFFFHQKKLQ